MVLPIIMAAVAVGSAVAGAVARGRSASQINGLIEDQIEIQKKADELLKQQRNLENRQSFFEYEKNQRLFRLQNTEKILQAQVAKQMADMDYMNQTLQTQQALFQVGQQRNLQEQEALQAKTAGFEQTKNAAAQNQETQQKVKEGSKQAEFVSGVTGQDTTAREMTRMEGTAQAAISNAGAVAVGVEDSRNSIEADFNQNSRLFDLQAQLSSMGINTQQQIFAVQNEALKTKLTQDQDLFRLERKAFNQASRANRIAERQKEIKARESDKLQSQGNITQMKAGMVNAPSTIGTILEVGGQVAGAVYGAQQYFANRWTPPNPTATGSVSSSGGLFAGASSYSNPNSFARTTLTPMTNASYPDLSGRGGYPSTIFTPPPRTGISQIGTMQDVIQSGRA